MKKSKLSDLDALIEAERRTVAKLQLNVQQAREEVRKGEEQQGKLAYSALADGEVQAQAALGEAEDILAKSQARARSADIALKSSIDKLEALQAERHRLFLEQQRADYAREAVELIRADSEELESALMLLTGARETIRERLRKMETIATAGGIDVARVHGRIRENLRHAIESRGQFESVWMSRDNRELFKQPISTLMQAVLKSLIPDIEGEERKKTA